MRVRDFDGEQQVKLVALVVGIIGRIATLPERPPRVMLCRRASDR